MKPEIVDKLHHLNQEFYQSFSRSFSSTRERVQPGVRKIMAQIAKSGNFLDIGCGNGNLAVELKKADKHGLYFGVDFSEELLEIARQKADIKSLKAGFETKFISSDIFRSGWRDHLPDVSWDVVMMFAVLHHIPDEKVRKLLLASIHRILPEANPLYLSAWQIQNSPRLLKHVVPWSEVGIEDSEVELGDVLMDWRAQSTEEGQRIGLRYVHIFSKEELQRLADEAGFEIADSFYSDGKEGNLAIYQKWEKKK